MITDRIGRHEVLLPINHNFNKICIIGYFLNQNTRNSTFCFASREKKSHLSARAIARTVQLLRHDAYCPINQKVLKTTTSNPLQSTPPSSKVEGVFVRKKLPGCSCYLQVIMPILRGTQRQFSENICSEDDLRSGIIGPFVVKFLACLLPLLGFSNIPKMV